MKLYATVVDPSLISLNSNARPYRVAIVHDFLESEKIGRMEWPVYSSDLNPIENL